MFSRPSGKRPTSILTVPENIELQFPEGGPSEPDSDLPKLIIGFVKQAGSHPENPRKFWDGILSFLSLLPS